MELCKPCPTCGTENSTSEMLCTRCFGDISGITPCNPAAAKPVATADKTGYLRLLTTDGRQIELLHGDIAGRAGAGGELFREYPAISRRHAMFEYADNGWQLTDLGSTNGTFIDGEKIEPETATRLSNGQEIRFGSTFTAILSIA